MNIFRAISAVCWILFWLYWFINNRNQKETKQVPNSAQTFPYRILWGLAFVFLLFPRQFYLNFAVLPNVVLFELVGALISMLGLIVCIWARKTLAGNWSMQLDVKKGHELITKGPYAFIRHPIYTGFLLLFLGTALEINTVGAMIGLFILIIGCYLRIIGEEKLMIKTFGDKYINYKAHVKSLVPYLL